MATTLFGSRTGSVAKLALILALGTILFVGKSFWLSRLFENLGSIQMNKAAFLSGLSDNERKALLIEGQELFRRAIAEDAGYSVAYGSLGLNQHKLGNEAEATAALEKATQLDPAGALNHDRLARAYWAAGQTEQAIASAERAGSFGRLMDMGNVLLAQQRDQEALLAFQGALAVAPGNTGAQYGIWRVQFREVQRLMEEGNRHRQNKDYAQAEEWYRRAAEVLPESESPYLYLAGSALEQRDFARAEKYLTIAEEKRPDNAWVYVSWGRLRREQGREEEAIGAFLEAIRREPRGFWLYMELAATYQKFGQREEAIAQYHQALEIGSQNAYDYYLIGLALFEEKDYAGAIEALEKSVGLNLKDGRAHLWLGRSYARLERIAEARREFEVALLDERPEVRREASGELAKQ